MKKYFLCISLLFSSLVTQANGGFSSIADSCQKTAKDLIKFGYSEGGLSLKMVQGPFSYNEAFYDKDGNPGLKYKAAFVVTYSNNGKVDEELRIAQCIEGEPSSMADSNHDGIVDLSDLVRVSK